MWKLYGSIHKVKSEIVSTGKSKRVITKVAPLTTRRRWSSLIYNNQFALRLIEIERAVEVQLSKVQYNNMIMTYNLLRICFDRQYDTMVNYTLWVEFLEPLLKCSRHTQMVIVLLIRTLVNAINKEIWRAFLDRKSEVLAVWDKTRMRKEKAAQRLLTQASKPAALQIKEQVSLEIDNKLKLGKRKQETTATKKSVKKQKFSVKDGKGRSRSPDRVSKQQGRHFNKDKSRSRTPPSHSGKGKGKFHGEPYSSSYASQSCD